MAKKVSLKFDFGALEDDFFDNTHLLGIVAPLPDYQFCWHLNHILNLDFRKCTHVDIVIYRKSREYIFNVYEYQMPNSQIVHYLYNNKYEGEYLLPEFKNFDFVWLVKSDEDDFLQIDLPQVVESINQIPQVQLITEIPLEKVKNKSLLIL